jgi:CRISPR-associated endonuclease/helicase Cas3
MSRSLLFSYWGKAKPQSDHGPQWHLLVYHSLDVAAVAEVWWRESSIIRNRFCYATGLAEPQAHAWVLFFIALHDYGKWDIRFQFKALDTLKALYPTFEPDMIEPEGNYFHGSRGHNCFLSEAFSTLGFSEQQLDYWRPWLAAVTGHHGSLPDAENAQEPMAEEFIIERDRIARQEWLQVLETLFLTPAGLSLKDSPPDCPDMLAGFCAVCDWLGSNDQHFLYDMGDHDIANYWKTALSRAQEAFVESGLFRPVQGMGGMTQLFPDKQPRQLQTIIDDLPITAGLTIVEAPTGSGKTEMALAYASKLLAAGVAESIVFALPTQATANAMLTRLEDTAGKLFADGSSVVLAHGKARYNKNFQALKQAAMRLTVQIHKEERDASVQCIQWLGASRKRVFLGQIGVCTIDQVLLSVLPVRHQFVRAFGVRKSILIIDEIHAYDAYMYGLLGQVLSGQQQAGGSTLLLSATLPFQQKEALVSAWGAELPSGRKPEETPYPLITQANVSGQVTTLQLPDTELPESRRVQIERYTVSDLLPDDALCQQLIAVAEQGGLIGVVCNLVADAQKLAQHLREMTDVPIDLFHARFRFMDRQIHELNAIERYGAGDKRSLKGRILVATQVIEQSLDLDFDWLLSQLCPIDLLFQRLGRLHRHKLDRRPLGFEQPHCTVLMPLDANFGLHGVVYGCERVLLRTQQLLSEHDSIPFPSAYRDWIERVYQTDPWTNESEQVTAAYETFADEQLGRYFSARQVSKADATPWPDTEGAAAKLTRDGDSNLNVLLIQDTPQGLALLDGRLRDELGEDERDEAIDLNTVGVPTSWSKSLGVALDDGSYQLVLRATSENCWETVQQDMRYSYSPDLGLVRTEEA